MQSTIDRLHGAVRDARWVLHYQPIVELATGTPAGMEALVRWQPDDEMVIPPAEFIPLAEENGLIGAISDWVIEELLRQWDEWADQTASIFVSFNLSPRELHDPGLAGRLMSKIDAWGVEPAQVLVEITESVAMLDPDRSGRALASLRSRGVRIALDDFGSGHSSLGRLKDLSVDVLKIDRSFVRDLPDDRAARRLATAIIGLALDLGMEPMAEGIERDDQRAFLLDRGCILGQGYLFGRPQPAAEMRGFGALAS
jgi:EAL domain-containing protein (putative c-di-GMP-specific phosphodiesterase class I)